MSSVESVLIQLTNRLISETSVPTDYLLNPLIVEAITKYNWTLGHSHMPGWTHLIRVINYSS